MMAETMINTCSHQMTPDTMSAFIEQQIQNGCGVSNDGIIKVISKLCEEQIKENSSNMHIKQKYEWLVGYVESVSV